MNKFFVILLFFCNLAIAQDAPTETKQVDPIIIDVDPRCKNAVIWGVSLTVKKQNGHTHEQARKKLEYEYMFGSLGNTRPEVVAYMFDIIDLVYKNETVAISDITQTANEVNELCVTFMETPPEKPKPNSIKT